MGARLAFGICGMRAKSASKVSYKNLLVLLVAEEQHAAQVASAMVCLTQAWLKAVGLRSFHFLEHGYLRFGDAAGICQKLVSACCSTTR